MELIAPGTSIYDNKRNNVIVARVPKRVFQNFSTPPLLRPLVAVAFSKVNKSVVSRGRRTDLETAEDSPPEISSEVRCDEHQGRSNCSDTGFNQSPCYSFEVGYTFIFFFTLT